MCPMVSSSEGREGGSPLRSERDREQLQAGRRDGQAPPVQTGTWTEASPATRSVQRLYQSRERAVFKSAVGTDRV